MGSAAPTQAELHGVVAPNFKHRPSPHGPQPCSSSRAREPLAAPPPPMSWMQRLKRVFYIDIERCRSVIGREASCPCLGIEFAIAMISSSVIVARPAEGGPNCALPTACVSNWMREQ